VQQFQITTMTCNNTQYHQALQSLRDSIDAALTKFEADAHPQAVPGIEVTTTPGLYPENISIVTDGSDTTVTITPDSIDPYTNYNVTTDDVITFGSASDEAVSF